MKPFFKRLSVLPILLVLSNAEIVAWVFINDRFNYRAIPWVSGLSKWLKK